MPWTTLNKNIYIDAKFANIYFFVTFSLAMAHLAGAKARDVGFGWACVLWFHDSNPPHEHMAFTPVDWSHHGTPTIKAAV